MPLLVVVDAPGDANSNPQSGTDVHVRIYNKYVLPVFTSLKSYSEFVQAQHSAQDPIQPAPLEVDPPQLVTMVKQLEATADLELLAFDPVISPSGSWICPEGPISVMGYCRFISELDHETKKKTKEFREKLLAPDSSPEECERILRVWLGLWFDEMEANARARMKEWVIEEWETDPWEIDDDSWGRQQDIPT